MQASITLDSVQPHLCQLNAFWADYADWCLADHDSRGPFLSANAHTAATTFTGAVLALALQGATWSPYIVSRATHRFDYHGMQLQVTMAKPAIAYLQVRWSKM